MTGVVASHVRETDAFTLSMERDPLLRSTIVAIALFDRSPDWDILVDRIDRATRLTPTFRQRLQPTPLGLAPPRWVTDPDFDLAFHLRRMEAPAPKTFHTAIEFARTAGMDAFDPARPLWEFTLIDGLTGGRAALVMKLHHSLTDGIGGVQLATHVVDLHPEPVDMGPMPAPPLASRRGPLDAWWDVFAYDLTRAVGMARSRISSIPGDARKVMQDPVGSVRDGAATAAALARFVRPITSTRSQVMTERRLQWHFATLDVPLRPLKEAAKRASGTLNDGFVGGVTGGLRRYHEKHGSTVDTLRLTMPISIRNEDDPEGGNRVTLVRFEVPVGIEDPIERMREIDRLAAELRHDRALPWSNTVAGVLNLLPNSVTGQMLKHVDFLASNVPGFDKRIYVGGAEILAFFPFGPTLGSAANITLMSYRDTCHIGVNTDVGAVPDPQLFLDCLRDGFEEVLDLAGPHQAVQQDLD
ncbi:MAG: wax ester/triacylglycerol synthase family O-acyltransferase [Acidimicrobiales bacterium]